MQWDQGEPWVEPDRPKNGPLGKGTSNNTLSLPRDLSVGYNGTSRFVKQAFIPELKTLRRGHTELVAQSLPTGGAGEPPPPARLVGRGGTARTRGRPGLPRCRCATAHPPTVCDVNRPPWWCHAL